MKYLLDTNTVIAILNDSDSKPAKMLRTKSPADVFISAIIAHELYYGAFKSANSNKNKSRVDSMLFSVLDFDSMDAVKSGEIRARLASQGTPIGPLDVLVAGQALSRDLVLVTRNIREFERIAELKLQNWHN